MPLNGASVGVIGGGRGGVRGGVKKSVSGVFIVSQCSPLFTHLLAQHGADPSNPMCPGMGLGT